MDEIVLPKIGKLMWWH